VLDYAVVVNADWWNGLDPEIRAGLTKAMAAATKVNNDVASKLNEDAKAKIAASSGVTIHTLDADQRAKWKAAMKPVWDQFRDQIGGDVVDAAMASNGGS
jgi:C4-dicarboxylate-binding protein DctP